MNTILNPTGYDREFKYSPYETTNISCEFIDPISYTKFFQKSNGTPLMSFNIQSVFFAKFPEFKELIFFIIGR
jgi:hypothetical protein